MAASTVNQNAVAVSLVDLRQGESYNFNNGILNL